MTRQSTSPPPFRTLKRNRLRGDNVDFHTHDEAQLIFALAGTTQVYTDTGRWLVPPQLAVWVPAGTELRMIYWQPSAIRQWAPDVPLDREFALRVSPLLRELIQAAFELDATRVAHTPENGTHHSTN